MLTLSKPRIADGEFRTSIRDGISDAGVTCGADLRVNWMMSLPLSTKDVLVGQHQIANSDDAMYGDRQNTRIYRTFQPLSIRTMLSPEQLQDHGLQIAGYETTQGWLVPIDADDRAGTVTEPDWLEGLIKRIDDLREIAAQEDMPFSEASANDARAFAAQLRHADRPSAFLIGNGNVRLLWSNVKGEQIGLQFLGDGNVQYVAFAQRDDRSAQTMGNDQVTAMMRVIAAIGIGHVLRG